MDVSGHSVDTHFFISSFVFFCEFVFFVVRNVFLPPFDVRFRCVPSRSCNTCLDPDPRPPGYVRGASLDAVRSRNGVKVETGAQKATV